jgi:uncharacterized UPF0146 family protein
VYRRVTQTGDCMNKFEDEQKRIEEKIWSLITVKNAVVIDVGIGENARSTQALIERGASVIAVDTNVEALLNHATLDAVFVCCDMVNPPFKPGTADVAVFNFTLHEINPLYHSTILSGAARVASQVMIVEPNPGTTPGYQEFENVWRESMHAVGKFEDYKPLSYWETLLKTSEFRILLSERIEHKEDVPPQKRKNMVQFTIEWLKEEHVPEEYMRKARNLLKYIAHVEMKLSDITVVIGESEVIPYFKSAVI